MPTVLCSGSPNWHGSPVGQGEPFALWALATPPQVPPYPHRSTLDPDRGYYGGDTGGIRGDLLPVGRVSGGKWIYPG